MKKDISLYLKVFAVSFLIMVISLIPGIIAGKGYFIFAADYAYQEIPFYYHVADAFQKGNIGWDWYVNLGADFIGAFSYYSIGSIFFWLIGWIKAGKITVLLMPFLMGIKAGTAALTSYAYIRRYIKDTDIAFVCALLYAFSGFQLVSMVFYTFADAIAIFPLLLLSFELLVLEDRKVIFLIMTAVMAYTNFFFFFGQVVFIIMYYTLKCIKKEFKFSVQKFALIAFESVTGVMIAAMLLIPAYNTVFSLGRSSNFLTGVKMISYSDNTIIPRIIQSVFMLPDIPGSAMLFDSENSSVYWATISLYLPLFSFAGVWVYMKNRKNDLITRLLQVCFIAAVIPVFNSAFYLFNSAYYARWFYMPLLFMSIATGKSLEEKFDLMPGLKFNLTGVIIFSIIALLPKEVNVPSVSDYLSYDDNSVEKAVRWFRMSDNPVVFWQTIAFSVVGLCIVYCYIRYARQKGTMKKLKAALCTFILITSTVYLNNSRESLHLVNLNFRETALEYKPELEYEGFFRINDINESFINNNFIWGYPTISSFHTIDIESDEKLYRKLTPETKTFRNVYTEDDYPVYSLLSVRYLFNHSTNDDLNVENFPVDIKGFELYDKQGYFYIYENKYFIPMGFMYDYYITDDRLQEYLDSQDFDDEKDEYHYRQLVMLRALVISEEDAEKYSSLLKPLPYDMLCGLDVETYYSDCLERSSMSCDSFEYDSHGFRAEIIADKAGLLYFSVPEFKGWSAEVNGTAAEIVTVHYGLSAVKIEEGKNHIEFSYETPGLKMGKIITLSGLTVLIVYSAIVIIIKRKNSKGSVSTDLLEEKI